MAGLLDEGVEGVAEGAGAQDARPGDAASQGLRRQQSEDRPEDQVGRQVTGVPVKRQGGHRPPPFPVHDPCRLHGP